MCVLLGQVFMGYQGQSSTKLWVSTFIPACTSYRPTETRGKLSENLSLPFLTVRRASLALARTRGCQFFRPWCPTMLRTVSTFFENLSSGRPDLLAVLKVLVLELATAGHHSRDNITSLVTQIATHHAYSCQPSFHDTDENKLQAISSLYFVQDMEYHRSISLESHPMKGRT